MGEMKSWAENEIRLACERERAGSGANEGEWDYGCACYESALKAFKSLCADGHSGFSIGLTKQILNRLIDGKVLTPIEDTPDIWDEPAYKDKDGGDVYQCKRMSSLFKTIYPDGTVKYCDLNRIVGVDINDGISFYNKLISNIIDEMYPITMPYIPEDRPFRVYIDDFLFDPKNGDYDTRAILNVVKPDGEKVAINRYFKESEDSFVEITLEEFLRRMELSVTHGGKNEEQH